MHRLDRTHLQRAQADAHEVIAEAPQLLLLGQRRHERKGHRLAQRRAQPHKVREAADDSEGGAVAARRGVRELRGGGREARSVGCAQARRTGYVRTPGGDGERNQRTT